MLPFPQIALGIAHDFWWVLLISWYAGAIWADFLSDRKTTWFWTCVSTSVASLVLASFGTILALAASDLERLWDIPGAPGEISARMQAMFASLVEWHAWGEPWGTLWNVFGWVVVMFTALLITYPVVHYVFNRRPAE